MPYTNVNKSSDHFNVVKWTGTSSSPVNVTGFGHNPDMIWNKYANGAGDHQLYDAVRTATKMIIPNSSAGESTNANGVTAFISDGFTAGSDINVNGGISIAHGWKANGAGVSNTDGDITSTVSANTTSGFSIIKFTGNSYTSQSFGHGLNGTPKYWMIKNITDSGDNWQVYLNGTDRAKLDTAEVFEQNYLMTANSTTITTPSTSGGAWGNANGKDFIVYAFEEIPGFSKFGTYKTNNSVNDGPFIYTGHKPKFIIAKNMTAGGYNWVMWNAALNPTNQPQFFHHHPNTNDTWVDNTNNIDMLSNGFRLKDYTTATNGGGDTIFYMSFAEAPLVGSNNVPCTAR